MAIDLMKNKDSLTKAYEKVLDENDDTDWALFGYESQTPTLKVIKTGDGGVEELTDELSSGKMMYAYCRIRDPNTGLYKFVLIHWTGEGVPENIRLKFTSHLKDLQNFLRSIHLTIPARYEDDIDKDDIANKVAKSSGANYSFHMEKARPIELPGPVGTNYQQTVAAKEINITARDQFWAKAEKDEFARQKAEKIKQEEARKKQRQREEKERYIQCLVNLRETKERDKIIYEHMREVNRQRQAELRAEEEKLEAERQQWEQNQKENTMDEDERRCRSDRMTKERTAEAAHLVSSHASSAREFFKKQEHLSSAARRTSPQYRKICCTLVDQQEREELEPSTSQKSVELCVAGNNPEPSLKPVHHDDLEAGIEQIYMLEKEHDQENEQECELESSSESEAFESSPFAQDSLQNDSTLQQSTDVEEEVGDWKALPAEDFEVGEKQACSYLEDSMSEQHHEERQSLQVINMKEFEEELKGDNSKLTTLLADRGKCARALYDYQADDDTEISFDPDDIITNIEQIDDGWWQGFGPDGSYGMFPANYVELLE